MKYRKKPVEIEAVQYTSTNIDEIENFIGGKAESMVYYDQTKSGVCIVIKTLEGNMVAQPLDYIIKGVKGEFYPCKPDIFEQTYEVV